MEETKDAKENIEAAIGGNRRWEGSPGYANTNVMWNRNQNCEWIVSIANNPSSLCGGQTHHLTILHCSCTCGDTCNLRENCCALVSFILFIYLKHYYFVSNIYCNLQKSVSKRASIKKNPIESGIIKEEVRVQGRYHFIDNEMMWLLLK